MRTTWKQLLTGDYPRDSFHGRMDRRFFVGFVNLALLCAVIQTGLDTFDVRLSWWTSSKSPGLHMKVARQHWGYLNLDFMGIDLGDKLPKNVEPWGLSAAFKTEYPDTTTKVLSRVASLPLDLLWLSVIWILRKIVLTSVGTRTSDSDPFVPANLRRIQVISLLLLFSPLVQFATDVAENELVSRLVPLGFAMLTFEFSYSYFWAGVMLAVLAQVFKIGIRLREDAEGLV